MTAALAIVVGFLLSNMPSPVYPLWQDAMGFTASTTTVLFAIYQAGVLIGLVVLGRLADRIGWRPMLAAAMAATGVGALMFAFALSPEWLLAARALSGLSVGVLASCGSAAVTEERERRGREDGPVIASVVTSVGLAFGPLIGGIGVDLNPSPTRSTFVLEFALAAVVAAVILAGLRASRSLPPAMPTDESPATDRAPRVARSASIRAMLTAALLVATAGIVCAIYMSIGSGFVRDALQVTSGTVGGLLVFVVFASAFASQLALSRTGPSVQGAVSMTASIVAAVLLLVGLAAENVVILFVSAALSGASQGLAQTAGLTIARRVTPLVRLRGAFAWLNFASYLFGGGFVLLTGALLTRLPLWEVTAAVGGVVCILAVAGLAMLRIHRSAIAAAGHASPVRAAATMEPQPDRG